MIERINEIRCPVLVLGIGNILLRDEGFGPYVIRALENVELPEYVELLDGGTAGADLLDFVCDRRKVIVIDAIECDFDPGTVVRLDLDDLETMSTRGVSLHELGISQTLMMARQLCCEPEEVVIIGTQPKELRCGLGLSPEMASAIPTVLEAVLNELPCRAFFEPRPRIVRRF